MGLNGEDKRMRALFCELKREEERTSPLFAETWNSAEAEFHRSGVRRLRFQSSANLLRFATAVLLVSFVSLVVVATVLLPKYLHRQPTHDYAKQEAVPEPRATSAEPPRSREVPNSESGKPTDRPLAIRRSVRVKKSPVASAQRAPSVKQNGLSRWQSPTATLLRSASDEWLRFVPSLNQSAQKMQKFLSNDLN